MISHGRAVSLLDLKNKMYPYFSISLILLNPSLKKEGMNFSLL